MKTIKKVLSIVSAFALLASTYVGTVSMADDVDYINIYNSQGTWGSEKNQINCSTPRELITGDPVRGEYTKLSGSNVFVAEGNDSSLPELFIQNMEAGRMLVMECDFMPDENTQYVSLYTYYTMIMTQKIDLTALNDGVVKVGEWNHLKVVADIGALSKSNNGTTINRIPAVYFINGVSVNSYNSSIVAKPYTIDAFKTRLSAGGTPMFTRIRFDAKDGTTTTMGIDNTAIRTVDADETLNVDCNKADFVARNLKNVTSKYESGLAGRDSDDRSFTITNEAADGYFEIDVPTTGTFIKQEFDYLPRDGFVNVKAQVRNTSLPLEILYSINNATTANQWIKLNQWNHISLITEVVSLDINTGAAKLSTECYVNGNKTSTAVREYNPSTDASYKDFTGDTGLGRLYFPMRYGLQPVGVMSSYDNMRVMASTSKPSPTTADTISGSNIDIEAPTRYENGKVTVPEGYTVSDIKMEGGTVCAFGGGDYNEKLLDDDELYEGDLVAATDSNGIVTYYDVSVSEPGTTKIEYASFTKDGENASRTNLSDGTYTYKLSIDNPSTEDFDVAPIMALYSADDRLLDVQLNQATVSAKDSDEVSVSLDVDVEEGSYIKTFVWNSALGMIPIEDVPHDDIVVACWGDSLTFGQGAHPVGGVDNSYPKVLGDLTGETVYNMGVPGETVITYASRQGAVDILTTDDYTIPADTTPVTIDFYGYDKDHATEMGMIVPRDVRVGGWTPVTIAGVEGTLTCTIAQTWPRTLESATFTRTAPGEEVHVSANTQIYPSSLEIAKKADLNIIYGMSNGGWNNDNGSANDNKPADLVSIYRKMIAGSKDPSKYIVVLYASGNISDYPKTNAALAEAFGEHVVDAATYLRSDKAFADAGLTKTEADAEYIEQGCLPYSFLNDPENDKSHMNATGYARLAYIIYQKMIELGYAN